MHWQPAKWGRKNNVSQNQPQYIGAKEISIAKRSLCFFLPYYFFSVCWVEGSESVLSFFHTYYWLFFTELEPCKHQSFRNTNKYVVMWKRAHVHWTLYEQYNLTLLQVKPFWIVLISAPWLVENTKRIIIYLDDQIPS